MAFATVTIEDKKNHIVKEAPVGFSWTVLFFGAESFCKNAKIITHIEMLIEL